MEASVFIHAPGLGFVPATPRSGCAPSLRAFDARGGERIEVQIDPERPCISCR